MSIIELENVEKTFTVRQKAGRVRRTRSEVRAVDDVSFSITSGATVGYIGPNGARWTLQYSPEQGKCLCDDTVGVACEP